MKMPIEPPRLALYVWLVNHLAKSIWIIQGFVLAYHYENMTWVIVGLLFMAPSIVADFIWPGISGDGGDEGLAKRRAQAGWVRRDG